LARQKIHKFRDSGHFHWTIEGTQMIIRWILQSGEQLAQLLDLPLMY